MHYYLEKTRPSEKRYVRGNQSPFMNKTSLNGIMEISKLREFRKIEIVKLFKQLYVLLFLRKSKREFFWSLNEQNWCDNNHDRK